jgi:DNA gyrase/topoisomerase IV subunit A
VQTRFSDGGVVVGTESIKRYLSTGLGILTMHAVVAIEEWPNGKEQRVRSSIFCAVNGAVLIPRIAELVHEQFRRELTTYETNRMKMPGSEGVILGRDHASTT